MFSTPWDNDQGAGLLDCVGRVYFVLKETIKLGDSLLGHEWKTHWKVAAGSSSEEAVTSDGGGQHWSRGGDGERERSPSALRGISAGLRAGLEMDGRKVTERTRSTDLQVSVCVQGQMGSFTKIQSEERCMRTRSEGGDECGVPVTSKVRCRECSCHPECLAWK